MTQALVHEISSELTRILSERGAQARGLGAAYDELWQLAIRCVGGGKLLRPRLVMGAFDAFTDHHPESTAHRDAALTVAAALEILHYAFLLHDDLIDEDLLRRGQPNLIGHLANGTLGTPYPDSSQAQRLHWARSSGLLIGDLMLTIAHQIFARVHLPEAQRIALLDVLDATVTETVAGEYYDVGLADRCLAPSLAAVLEMTRMKTATYTFELPLRVAAIMAGTDDRTQQQLGEIGRHLGLAFQLQDDLLSAFSMSLAHGKDQFSDFREGKETALIAFARNTSVWPALAELIGAEDFRYESGVQIQHLLVECGAKGFMEAMVSERISTAIASLTQSPGALPAPVCLFLLDLIDSLDGRTT
ncbi:polyprenyl synthetase family protein [Leucobacter sp. HY1910]